MVKKQGQNALGRQHSRMRLPHINDENLPHASGYHGYIKA
ncbi:hypothetical protein SFMTTN_3408 [Sulfuriferula multivorans]|uniref:Uncharacterized protein n=1 Tax=Sulfuriferula multivorans TaxID=1559896 RepID=A0A401K037_9PROT|nr:hypothetical protein SFMTTN_3408 [Sulfuriferula multivorans]